MTTGTVLLNGSYAESLVNFRGPLIRAMVDKGLRVHVSAPQIPPDVATAVRAMGAVPHSLKMQRTGLGPFSDLHYLWQLFALIRKLRPTLVVGYTIKPNIWGSIASALNGVRSASMVTGLGYAFIEDAGIKRKLVQGVARQLYRLATAANAVVVFQNPDDRRDFIEAGCLRSSVKARLVNGSGVDIAHFTPAVLPENPVFLLIARLLWSKGVGEYADAAASLRQRFPSARFVLAGFLDEGPDAASKADLERWIGQGVEFVGRLDDVRPAIAAASIFVLPSYREGTPRTVLEAMAMGRPIITTDAPGCRETTTDGDNGLLVPVGDSAALATAMERLMEDSALRGRMGRRSREICEQRFSASQVAATLLGHLGLADQHQDGAGDSSTSEQAYLRSR